MKTNLLKLVLGVAALTGPALMGMSAQAGGDYYGGGLKGMRGSYVPVPAPAPIPDYKAKWYLRADLGLGLGLDTGASESGATYGVDDFGYRARSSFGMGGLDKGAGDSYGHLLGFGVGYYVSPSFRMDFTGDFRAEKKNVISGSFNYQDYDVLTNTDTGNYVEGTVRDQTNMRSAIFMANGYYDISRMGSWKPYLGAGVGFAVNEIERSHTTQISVCNRSADPTCAPSGVGSYTSAKQRHYTYAPALSATAGVSYRLSSLTSLDFNYRYMYVGGTHVSATIGGNNSNVEIEDQHEHYIRAGLRWDIR